MTAWSLWGFPHQIWPFQKFCWFLSMREAEWSHRSPCVSVLGTRVKSKPYNDNVNVFRWYGNLVPQSHFNDMLNERFESVLNFLNKLSCVIMTMPSLYSVVSDSIFILSDITKQRALSRCKKISVSLNQPPRQILLREKTKSHSIVFQNAWILFSYTKTTKKLWFHTNNTKANRCSSKTIKFQLTVVQK